MGGVCQQAQVHAAFEIQTGAYVLQSTQPDHTASLLEPLRRHRGPPRLGSGGPHATFLITPILMRQGHSGVLGFLDYASPFWPWVRLAASARNASPGSVLGESLPLGSGLTKCYRLITLHHPDHTI